MRNHESDSDKAALWNDVYGAKAPNSVSWFRDHLETSLILLERAGVTSSSRIIDVGGGASTLVDDLLALGVQKITVVDLSPAALAISKARLGESQHLVDWIAGDLLRVPLPPSGFDVWHDRAVLHFLTDPADAARYAGRTADAVAEGGFAIIGGFAPDGPLKCNGQWVARRSASEIAALFSPAFELVDVTLENHETPSGSTQAFLYALLKRA